MRRSTTYFWLLASLLMLYSAASSHAELPAVKEGFTSDTELDLTLNPSYIGDREDWEDHHPGRVIDGIIRLSSGHGTPEGSNKIMIYGDRIGTLWSGEDDWSLSPRPTLVYLSPSETSRTVPLDFGPPAPLQPGLDEWLQTYLYSACLNIANGGGTRDDSATLTVRNEP